MFIKYFRFILLLFFLAACQSKQTSKEDFNKVLQCFKKVELPYKIEAGHGSENLLDSAFFHEKIFSSPLKWYQLPSQSGLSIEGLAPSHENVNCGYLMFENERFVVIDIQDTRIGFDRYLLVFSKAGDLIDGIPVAHLSKGRNGDESFEIEQFSEIDQNLVIRMTENIKHSFLETTSSEEKVTKTATYQIKEDGKIQFVKN
ncbi:hypothetical protein [Thermoflexibacter ruber]|uniref:Lipoprotein n=1 Tax=Thermoflexibacter ruber TaxID=1003 RepID=A0A1I2AU30_9BACT|nr:hypothetical protein [Thermoflexibacter ruber]SFE47515.1 hypothetical protein SAMN04488541_100210 [Thermoflexibacter ruber]